MTKNNNITKEEQYDKKTVTKLEDRWKPGIVTVEEAEKFKVVIPQTIADQLTKLIESNPNGQKFDILHVKEMATELGYQEFVDWLVDNSDKWEDLLFWGFKSQNE